MTNWYVISFHSFFHNKTNLKKYVLKAVLLCLNPSIKNRVPCNTLKDGGGLALRVRERLPTLGGITGELSVAAVASFALSADETSWEVFCKQFSKYSSVMERNTSSNSASYSSNWESPMLSSNGGLASDSHSLGSSSCSVKSITVLSIRLERFFSKKQAKKSRGICAASTGIFDHLPSKKRRL